MRLNDHSVPTTGRFVTIRPIRRTDAEIEAESVRRTSPQSSQFRFLGGAKALSPSQLKEELRSVNARCSMAFVATIEDQGCELEIGVSRYAAHPKSDTREMAVTVTDDWRQRGLGSQLVNQLIEFARGQGVKRLYAIDCADNLPMRELAQDLGMTAQYDKEDTDQIIYSLRL